MDILLSTFYYGGKNPEYVKSDARVLLSHVAGPPRPEFLSYKSAYTGKRTRRTERPGSHIPQTTNAKKMVWRNEIRILPMTVCINEKKQKHIHRPPRSNDFHQDKTSPADSQVFFFFLFLTIFLFFILLRLLPFRIH